MPRVMCLALEMAWAIDDESIEAELKNDQVWVTWWINDNQDSLNCVASSSPYNLLIKASVIIYGVFRCFVG